MINPNMKYSIGLGFKFNFAIITISGLKVFILKLKQLCQVISIKFITSLTVSSKLTIFTVFVESFLFFGKLLACWSEHFGVHDSRWLV
jgi:hypothetical protein